MRALFLLFLFSALCALVWPLVVPPDDGGDECVEACIADDEERAPTEEQCETLCNEERDEHVSGD